MLYRFAGCELDLPRRELRRDGAAVPLEPQVFDVLAYLVRHHERVVTKQELLEHIWPEKYISEAALSSRLMAARKAIGDSGDRQQMIRTLHRRGYRFVATVESTDPRRTDAARGNVVEQRVGFCTASDGVRIAYATAGEGPPLVKAANWLSHLEHDWVSPVWKHWMRELSEAHRLIRYDERGCGLSDRDVHDSSFDAWVRDLEAVVDAVGVERFALFGMSQGASIAIAYAVRHPERVSQLVLYGSYARGWSLRGPSGRELEERSALLTLTREGWGRDNPAYRQIFASYFIPNATPDHVRWFNDLCRLSTSAENAVRFMEEFANIDVDHLLSQVRAPTIVIHARGDTRAPLEEGRRIAARIPNARFVTLGSENHILLSDEPAWHEFQSAFREFLRP